MELESGDNASGLAGKGGLGLDETSASTAAAGGDWRQVWTPRWKTDADILEVAEDVVDVDARDAPLGSVERPTGHLDGIDIRGKWETPVGLCIR